MVTSTGSAGDRRKSAPLFFPVLALFAATVVPLSLQAMTSSRPWLPALASPLAHSRELLFGFGLGVVAGYLLGVQPPRRLWLLFALWLGARVAWQLSPGGNAAFILQAAFALGLAGIVAPRFMGRGRKLRNLSMAPLIGLLALAAVSVDLLPESHWPAPRHLLVTAVLLFAWIMAFMGGRMIAPAAAGARYRQGENLSARVQPALEGAIIATLFLAVACALILSTLRPTGVLAIAAGLQLALRLLRWQLWRCHGRVDLWCLGMGYGWIAAGLILLGLALLQDRAPYTALHGITVGAMGTLIFNVMLRTHLQGHRQDLARVRLIPVGTALITLSALVRINTSSGPDGNLVLLWLAALAWSTAYLLLAFRLLRVPAPVRRIGSIRDSGR